MALRLQISLLALWMSFSVTAYAQEDEIEDFAELDLEELLDVVFTASKHRQSIFWSPSAITVFTREDIRSSGATDLADLLRRVPGFDVYRLKPSFPLVGARALTTASNNLVLVLIDGREALTEVSGFALWSSLTIDMDEVERVEVIRGPGSALYGANAFAAVVSITTVADQPQSGGGVFLSAGETGRQRLFGRVRHTTGLGAGTLSFGAGLGTERKRSPSDVRDEVLGYYRSHAYLRYREGRKLDLSLHAGAMVGGEVIYIQIGDMRFFDGGNYWIMGKSEFDLGEAIKLKAQLYYTYYGGSLQYRTTLWANDMWVADLPIFSIGAHSIDGQVQLDWHLGDNLLLICGGNLRYNTLDWEKINVSEEDELRAAVFAHLQWMPLDEVQLTGGLRLDANTFTETAISPRAAAVFRPFSDHAFRLGYGLAFRRPSSFESRTHTTIEKFNPAVPEIVELADTQFGNESLVNEKVHSFEAGWRGRFFEDHLHVSLDFFFSLYRDTITFVMDVPTRLGLPDLTNSTIRYENEGAEVNAVGGEAELFFRPVEHWSFWCNLGMREITNKDEGEDTPSEPRLRINLGGRFAPPAGLLVDIALHYVSAYEMPLMDPSNILGNPVLVSLGNEILVIARAGYRVTMGEDRTMEAGLTVCAPLGKSFREYAGAPMPMSLRVDTASDFGGEILTRLVSFYLRASF